ncbi:YpiF family protein [Bacillus salacetis]|uniref:YpiF family protein n=1 Tax=Bacillus salacetis TaxID=2315464 RepID=UPI003BA33D59
MNWNGKEVELYLKEKKYIDTAIIPLLPVGLEEEMKTFAGQGEFISLLSMHLEHQFKGRLMLFPAFTYLKTEEKVSAEKRLSEWRTAMKDSGFKYVFFLTSDSDWRFNDQELERSLMWIPSIPLDSMDEKYKHSIMEDQVKQLLNVIVKKWQVES